MLKRISVRALQLKIRKYVKQDWGFPFIAGFIILLLIAVIFVIVGRDSLAEGIADFAYSALVVGVFLQFVSFAKARGKYNHLEAGAEPKSKVNK